MWNATKRGVKRTRSETRKHWQSHVEAQGASGLSGAEYCRRHGLEVKGLYRWRRVFPAVVTPAPKGDAPEAPGPPVFAEVGIRGVGE
ncbi:MAG: hypothetical protein M1335_02195, partial [Chloroflexi bacterium]|nr:hypothetical protein [Chloroflexota bacterium]